MLGFDFLGGSALGVFEVIAPAIPMSDDRAIGGVFARVASNSGYDRTAQLSFPRIAHSDFNRESESSVASRAV